MNSPTWDILTGDALETLKTLPADHYQCVVTSPPYWGLRCYGVDGQYGLEATPDKYVATMVDVFREVRRALRPDGTLWLNLGDTYATDTKWGGSGGSGQREKFKGASEASEVKRAHRWTSGAKPKDLVGIPWRVAFALQADGWYLRSDIIWAKPNPMPESVIDRPTKAHEYLFLMSKAARYFYDAEAIREADAGTDHPRHVLHRPEPSGGVMSPHAGIRTANGRDGYGRNKRSVWTIATQAFPDAHFATFPFALVEPCILAGTSAKGACAQCGGPWARVLEKDRKPTRPGRDNVLDPTGMANRDPHRHVTETRTVDWKPTCKCGVPHVQPCDVLDPFCGSGTTGVVALRLARSFVGIELNPEYVEMAKRRICDDTPLFRTTTPESTDGD